MPSVPQETGPITDPVISLLRPPSSSLEQLNRIRPRRRKYIGFMGLFLGMSYNRVQFPSFGCAVPIAQLCFVGELFPVKAKAIMPGLPLSTEGSCHKIILVYGMTVGYPFSSKYPLHRLSPVARMKSPPQAPRLLIAPGWSGNNCCFTGEM